MTEPADPDDKTLLEFVARFAGVSEQSGFNWRINVPDYLHSVDAWLRDVAPKITGSMPAGVSYALGRIMNDDPRVKVGPHAGVLRR